MRGVHSTLGSVALEGSTMNVTDKVAVVTGGGRGIGRGIALALADNGADVAVADIVEDSANQVASEVEVKGRAAMAAPLDVTDVQSIEALVNSVVERFGRVDILVNNAGVIGAAGWEERETANEADWDVTFAVNVKGVGMVIDAVGPHMKERRYGKIVNIASVAGRKGTQTSTPYGASKAGVINVTQAAALDLAPFDINVNAICPGLLWTDMWERIADRFKISNEDSTDQTPREIFDRYVKLRTPLGREQTPEDIGNAAVFLASDAAKNITGQSLNVCGGFMMH